jgi:hypothetical protein
MREQFSLECWTQLDNHRTLEGAIRRVSARFAVDRNQPSIWQQMHTKKLEVHDDTVVFNHGNIKKYGDRPYTETFQSIGYHNQMEMNTRLAVSFLEVKEDRARNAMKLCVLGGVIRPLELLGAGDMSYLGLLKINPIAEEEAAKLNIRFDEGDVLKINFKTDPRDIVDDDSWDFIISKPFAWNLQGEITGQLVRPREKSQPNASEAERQEGRRLLNMNLPVKHFDASNLQDVRAAVDSSTPVMVSITFSESYKSEDRLIAAQDILLNGSRPVLPKDKAHPSDPDRKKSGWAQKWGEFLLMRDCRSSGTHDMLPSEISKNYMADNFTDTDQVASTQYLYNAPVTYNGLKIAGIQGFPGVGKTTFAAGVIVAKLLGDPQTKAVFSASSNQPVDVFVKKINLALQKARDNPLYAHLLQHFLAIRVYNDKSENRYILAMCDRNRLENLEQSQREREDDQDLADLEDIRALWPEYDPSNPDQEVPEHLRSVFMPSKTATSSQQAPVLEAQEQTSSTSEDPIDAIKLNTVTSDDGDEDEVDDDEDNFNSDLTPDYPGKTYNASGKSKGKKKSKGQSKKQKDKAAVAFQRQELYNKRTAVESDYTARDRETAVELTDAQYRGDDFTPVIYGGTLAGGIIDLGNEEIPSEKLLAKASKAIVDRINAQRFLPDHGVRDTRYQESELGIARHTINYAKSHSDEPVFASFLKACDDYTEQGSSMTKESLKERDAAIAGAFARVKELAALQGMTANNTGHPGNKFPPKVFLLVDEAGMANLGEFCMLVANMDVEECILLGDEQQLQPQVQFIRPVGLTREVGMSILRYFANNHWKMGMLNLQRRSAPGMMRIPSTLAYHGLIQDAPSTFVDSPKLQLAKRIRDWFNKEFPDQQSDQFYRYILLRSFGEVRDELTGSFFNLDTAAVIVNLQEKMVREGVIEAKDCATITHYTAQQRIHDFALAELHSENDNLNLADLRNYTTDEYQGDEGPLIWGDSVRTGLPGFTADQGRNVVLHTRGQCGFINVADTFHLQAANSKQSTPFMVRSMNEARRIGACIYIDPKGPHAWLLTHKHVHCWGQARRT